MNKKILMFTILTALSVFIPVEAQNRKHRSKVANSSQAKPKTNNEQKSQPQLTELSPQEMKKNLKLYFLYLKDRRYELFENSQLFYLDHVKPIFDELETIPEETSEEDVAKMQQELSDTRNRLMVLMPSADQFNSDIASYIAMLLSLKCNPLAIALVKDLDNPALAYELGLLKSYEYYSVNMRDPIEHIIAALEQNGWKKLKESDAAIRIFDKEWDNTLYLNSMASNSGDGIPFLNEQMKTIMALRMKGFDSKDELLQVMEKLTPCEEADEVAEHYGEIIENQNKIFSIENQLMTINDENMKFNELEEERYEVVEKWYDMREEIDKLLIDGCRYCLSYACDTVGLFEWMRDQMEPMLNSVYHKSYCARRDKYLRLFENYDNYTRELEAFLKRIYPYVRTAGGLSDEKKRIIQTSLHSLEYYSNYYSRHNEKNEVTSPYLDGIITEIEDIVDNGFVGALEKYNSLSEKLRVNEFEELDNKTFNVNGVSFTMVGVKGGSFTMGSTDESEEYSNEKPAHKVIVSSYYIGQTEVTQELWQAVMGSNSRHPYDCPKGAKLPMAGVSWNDCQGFIERLNSITGMHFRLPTEAEWEYAASGGSKSHGYKYSGSNNLEDAKMRPNELGIYDMSNNVGEWCQDWYDNYSSAPTSNPSGPDSRVDDLYRGFEDDLYRVQRGGRVTYRRTSSSLYGAYNGFRLAL